MRLPPESRCPRHATALSVDDTGGEPNALRCADGCRFPVVGSIPRFVDSDGYASAFGLQWKHYSRTQLDSYTGTTVSRDRLLRCLGGSFAPLSGASVLEVGCGAGRFTEILLDQAERVLACDLSSAVEANLSNCGDRAGYFVCQADVLQLPLERGAFDVVLALGMIQHTPSPERTIRALARMLKPGGALVLDHYAPLANSLLRAIGAVTPRHLLRHLFLRLSPDAALRAAKRLTRTILPLHRALWRHGSGARRARSVWRRVSPVFDYYDRGFGLSATQLEEWAFLDTFDALTDRYKHLRTSEEIARALRDAGLEVLACAGGGNGVEARARRPVAAPITAS